MKFKNLKYILPSAVIVLVLIIISGELILRMFGPPVIYEYDKTLGWRPKGNFSKTITVTDKSGEKYSVHYSTNEYGFREFGDINSNRKKILFEWEEWLKRQITKKRMKI